MPSPRSFWNSFHCWLYLFAFHSPGLSQQFLVVFLLVILGFWRPKKSFFLHILSVLSETRGSSLMPSSHNCFDRENSFQPSGAIQDSFQFVSPEPIISELFIPAFNSRSLNLTGASLKYSLMSSWSLRSLVSKFYQVSSFPNYSRCLFIFSSFISNSYGGSFKISFPSLSYQFIRYPNPTGGSLKTFSSLRYISFNPFYENK